MEQTPRWRRALLFVLPSFVAAALGSVATGIAEGFASGFSIYEAVSAAGFLSLVLVPIGMVAALAMRALWMWWQPAELWSAAEEEGGGAPRVAAWITYGLLAVWAVAASSFNAVLLLQLRTQAKAIIALASALIMVAVAAALIAGSRPAARGLAALYRRLDRRWLRKRERPLLSQRRVVIAAAVAVLGLLTLAWFVTFRPRLGHLEIAWLLYLAGFGVFVGIAHQLWSRLPRRARRWAPLAAVGLLIATGAPAIYVRKVDQYTMLEVWAESGLSGGAIDRIWDVQALRREFRLEEFRPEEKPGAEHPDVYLITIDTVRASRTSVYGGPAKTHALETFAKKCVVFERAFSPGNVTRRSVPSIVLGLSPFRVRGRVAGWALRLDPRHVLLAERFRAAGYDTAGFLLPGSHFWPKHRLGLIRGIDELRVDAKDGAAQTEQIVKFIEHRRESKPDKPVFVWIHYIDPHLWASNPDYGTGRTKKRYDKALVAQDQLLNKVFAALQPDIDHTVVAVTSDHGEGLGDRGTFFHSTSLYNEETHVPLLIHAPGLTPERLAGPVGLVDLAPSLLDLAGFVPPGMPDMDGLSLVPYLKGEKPLTFDDGEAYSVMVADRSVPQDKYALVAGRYKLITDGGEEHELYDIVSDRREKRDIGKDKPELLRELQLRLAARRKVDRISPF